MGWTTRWLIVWSGAGSERLAIRSLFDAFEERSQQARSTLETLEQAAAERFLPGAADAYGDRLSERIALLEE